MLACNAVEFGTTRDQCICLPIFIWRSTSNPKCHVDIFKNKNECQLKSTSSSKCHLNVTCPVVRAISISIMSIDMWFFSIHKSHYMSNSKSYVSVECIFIVFVQVFVCQMYKNL